MKKWLTISLIVMVLLLLAVRGVYLRVSKAQDEKTLYVSSLDFHFSAKVDSLKQFSNTNGLVYWHAIYGTFNSSYEDRVNEKLKFNSSLRFILPIAGKLAFHARDLEKYQAGDSLVINSDEDKIRIFRQGNFVTESEISQALSGSMF